eukprot:TRINITY_DN14624_c0_g1_i1.p1 TRINITY_DN14624_c0_g1~~TRINITY_DN14624_c0_g1_i1.p1  ORF type:complete len:253 (-),score=105.66 TRINITY_DN14624_c0_g1_i1:48-737(-)
MNTNNENLSPAVAQRLMREIRALIKDPVDDIKVHFDEENMGNIVADILGPEGTPYAGGTFRCQLVFGADFPSQPPKGYFVTKIYHPNVSKAGEICVNTLKKDWSPDLGIKHVLCVIRCLLIVPNPESALNEEAGKLLLDNYDDYFRRAAVYTRLHAVRRAEAEAVVVEDDGESKKVDEVVEEGMAAPAAAAAPAKKAKTAAAKSSSSSASAANTAKAKPAAKKSTLKRL